LIDWLAGLQTGGLINWLIDWLTVWLIVSVPSQQTYQLSHQQTN
jgi:hypothetical protein